MSSAEYLLNDNLQGLAKGHGLVVEDVEVELMAKVGRSFQQPVKLLLHHLIFLFRNLKIRSIAELVLVRLNVTTQENTNALQFKRSKYASQRGNL